MQLQFLRQQSMYNINYQHDPAMLTQILNLIFFRRNVVCYHTLESKIL